MSSTQKALVIDKKQGKFQLADIPIPKPGYGEILVKVQAAALNPVDWKIRKYGVLIDEYPAVVGSDIAGDVEDVGPGVTGFVKGDRVYVLIFKMPVGLSSCANVEFWTLGSVKDVLPRMAVVSNSMWPHLLR